MSISKFFKKNGRNKPVSEISPKVIDETLSGLNLIEERGKGLIDFVNKYRSLTVLLKPKLNKVLVSELFQSIQLLMKEELKSNKTEMFFTVKPGSLEFMCDEKLIEQILINLINNSLHVLREQKNAKIKLEAYQDDEGKITLNVIDNGPGIPEEEIDKIFIPFYTTRENGSGIGLSLSKQIMRLHGGTITARSNPGKETVFTLKF